MPKQSSGMGDFDTRQGDVITVAKAVHVKTLANAVCSRLCGGLVGGLAGGLIGGLIGAVTGKFAIAPVVSHSESARVAPKGR